MESSCVYSELLHVFQDSMLGQPAGAARWCAASKSKFTFETGAKTTTERCRYLRTSRTRIAERREKEQEGAGGSRREQERAGGSRREQEGAGGSRREQEGRGWGMRREKGEGGRKGRKSHVIHVPIYTYAAQPHVLSINLAQARTDECGAYVLSHRQRARASTQTFVCIYM